MALLYIAALPMAHDTIHGIDVIKAALPTLAWQTFRSLRGGRGAERG